jgi:hypothetical protein
LKLANTRSTSPSRSVVTEPSTSDTSYGPSASERVLGLAQALWPLTVVLSCRHPLGLHAFTPAGV